MKIRLLLTGGHCCERFSNFLVIFCRWPHIKGDLGHFCRFISMSSVVLFRNFLIKLYGWGMTNDVQETSLQRPWDSRGIWTAHVQLVIPCSKALLHTACAQEMPPLLKMLGATYPHETSTKQIRCFHVGTLRPFHVVQYVRHPEGLLDVA